MRRLLPIFLTLFLLLSQFGLLAHTYQDHQSNEICTLCLAAGQHDHALISSLPVLLSAGSFDLQEFPLQQVFTQRAVRYYAVRAPPHFL